MRTRHRGLGRAVAVVALLALGRPALAANILRRPGTPADRQAAQAAAQAAAAQAQASRAQAQGSLRSALDGIKVWLGRQDAARAAAQAAQAGDPPDGLVTGGLQVADGASAGSPGWQGAELPASSAQDGRTLVTVKQDDPTAILTWQTFNVGRGTDLHFDQTAGGNQVSDWIALNRVLDPGGKPSQILGSIKAEGQVYVINRNGIVFGGSSQVNVGSLLASSLDFAGATVDFRNGALQDLRTVTFRSDAADPSLLGDVTVAAGGQLSVNPYGRVLLLGRSVVNEGSIAAPDGQILLAAGGAVSLTSASRYYAPPSVMALVGGGDGAGTVENGADGVLSALRGNVTLAASTASDATALGEVRQYGFVTATTSVDANGSIWLGTTDPTQPVVVSFGGGSVTQILPDAGGKKAIGVTALDSSSQSQLTASAEKVLLLDGSTVYLPSGQVSLSTTFHSSDLTVPDTSRIYLGQGATLDVSGLTDVEVAMAQNEIQAELRAAELADNPVLRDSGLRSQTVYFDARLGGKLRDGSGLANLTGYYGLIERDVRQLMTGGGTVSLTANEIVTRPGSRIDLSGGSIRYQDGYVRSSQVLDASGHAVRIEDAVAGVGYTSIDGNSVVAHARWGVNESFWSALAGPSPHFEKGYLEGSSAGTLVLGTNDRLGFVPDQGTPNPDATGAFRIFDGGVRASTVVGDRQREVYDATKAQDPTLAWTLRPAGATLVIQRGGDIVISDAVPDLGAFGAGTSLGDRSDLEYQHVLPASWFNGKTFGSVSVVSGYTSDQILGSTGVIRYPTKDLAPGGALTVAAGTVVNLGDGGIFSFAGKRVDLDGTLLAPGGSVSLTAVDLPIDTTVAEAVAQERYPTVRLGATGVIDAAGRFTNDRLDGAGAPLRALNGGSVTLAAATVVLAPGSLVDVSGGGRLDATGTKVAAGNGGSLTIDMSRMNPQGLAPPYTWALDGTLRGNALGTGGALSIRTIRDVLVADRLPDGAGPSTLLLQPGFFTQGGFASYALRGQSVTVAEDTVLAPQVDSLVLPAWALDLAGGTRLADVLPHQVLHDTQGQGLAVQLSLSAVPFGTGSPEGATLRVAPGARILMNPGSTVQLAGTAPFAAGNASIVEVDGTIQARGGSISLLGVASPATATSSTNSLFAGRVTLGEGATLDASGWIKESLVGGLTRRTVMPGGTITVRGQAQDGTEIPLALVDIGPGTTLDASGIQHLADLDALGGKVSDRSRLAPTLVDGNAGAISISSLGGRVAGQLRLYAGGPRGAGGSLQVRGPVGMVVRQGAEGDWGGDRLTVIAQSVDDSGADDLLLKALSASDETTFYSGKQIEFDGAVNLRTNRSLTLDAASIVSGASGADVALDSHSVQLKGIYSRYDPSNPDPRINGSPIAGAGLTVNADLIDLVDYLNLGGFDLATFRASSDIRLVDTNPGTDIGVAGLLSAGTIDFRAAQVYATSPAQLAGVLTGTLEAPQAFPGYLVRSGVAIQVEGNGNPSPVPLAFGGRLTLRAPTITQNGVVRAPQGEIRLEARDWTGNPGTVTLGAGSLTSTSLEGTTVPFGGVGSRGEFIGYDQAGAAPTKSVALEGKDVTVSNGAVVDVSGGGDLLGFRFAPGNGGSKDILDQPGTFAILPGLGTAPAPLGGAASLQNATLRIGSSVYLAGVPGLADGYYTLLPAHYALLPGGLAVKPLGGSYAALPASYLRPDGAVVAGGYRAVAVSGGWERDPAYGRFAVMSHDVFEKYSQLFTYRFDQVAAQRDQAAGLSVRLPVDAGSAVISTSGSLVLAGQGKFEAPEGGLLGALDISAPRIAVLGGGAAAPDSSYLALDVGQLGAFGAGSVLLGGVRSASTDPTLPAGTALSVTASEVFVDTGGGAWQAPEMILAAADAVRIQDGSRLVATGATAASAGALLLTNSAALAGTYGPADGALLRLSTGGRADVLRLYGAQAGKGTSGTLEAGGATLDASTGSLSLDGSRVVALSDAATLSARQLDLSSARVNVGDVPQSDLGTGTNLSSAALGLLGSASDLLLHGYDGIHLYLHDGVTLGSRDASGVATLKTLTLDSGLIQGHAGDGVTGRIVAGELVLRNSGGGATGSAGGGTLSLDADTLVLGPGDVRLAGYGTLTAAAGGLEARGDGSFTFDGSAAIQADQVREGAGVGYTIAFGGDVALSQGGRDGTGQVSSDALGLGGRLAVSGSSLSLDTAVVLPAGTFQATATQGSLTLGGSASIDVRGRAVDFDGQARYAPGGAILVTAGGDLAVAAGAQLDVSGAATGGDAGRIEVTAGGQAKNDGAMRGAAQDGFQGGSFAVDAGTLAGFSALNAALEANGFHASRSYRVRQQDLTLAAGERITAHEVVLQADGGSLLLAGAVDASGTADHPDGGRISLLGGDGVTVEGTLDAHAFSGDLPVGAFDPSAGEVVLAAQGGRLHLGSGATIDVSRRAGEGGTVVLRAPRDSGDVAIDPLAGQLLGAREVLVQGVVGYRATGGVVSSVAGAILADGTSWLAGAPAIRTRLAGSDQALAALVQVGAGAVVTSDVADLTVDADLALNGRMGAGYLGLSALGDLLLAPGVALSDGFASASRSAALLTTDSSTLDLEAGGSIRLAAGSLIRTGTGNISARAGGDVVFDPAGRAVLYTAGRSGGRAPGFTDVPAGPLGEFPTQGGSIDIRAGQDVIAPITDQSTSAWLFRYGASQWDGESSFLVSQQTSWSVVFANFDQTVGALGGGDVQVQAGRDVYQLQVAIPTTGQLTTAVGAVAKDGDLVVRGGGDLQLDAGRDILGGVFVLGQGRADLRAGGRVGGSSQPSGEALLRTSADGRSYAQRPVSPLLGLGDATASLVAGSSATIEGAFDPMLQGQLAQNLAGAAGSVFVGYTDRTALDVTAMAGSVRYANDPLAASDLSAGSFKVSAGGTTQIPAGLAPPSLRLASLESSAQVQDYFGGTSVLEMAAAARGSLELLAQQDVRISLQTLQMDDTPAGLRRGPDHASSTTVSPAPASATGLIHAGDPDPVRIYALEGTVCADRTGACATGTPLGAQGNAEVRVPKPIEVLAGTDVYAGSYVVQHDGANATSIIQAGRDLFDVGFQVRGEGAAFLEAGRDVVEHVPPAVGGLQNRPGAPQGGFIYSKGNTVTNPASGAVTGSDPALPADRGADITILAGLSGGAHWDAFGAAYLDPANSQHLAKTYLSELADYMNSLGYGTLSSDALRAAFDALAPARRQTFLDRVYFSELKESGIEYNDPSSQRYHSYDRGNRAVDLLFQKDPSVHAGDVILSGKLVATNSDADITILAPYGQVEVGTAFSPSARYDADGGVLTRRGGDIRIMADQSIDLYTSRVFTLQGGDVTMWTSRGSITAGSGSKTSVRYVRPSYTMDPSGAVSVNVFGLSTGAGIGVLDALANAGSRPPSRLDLIAPLGEVDAGDAGIRVVGNLNIAAAVVVGMENIQASGVSTGVPKVEVPSLSVLTTAAQVSQSATKEGVGPQAATAASAAAAVADLPSIITVEVIGYETKDTDHPEEQRNKRAKEKAGKADVNKR